MSDNKKYYYLKLKDNFFEDEAMIILEGMQDGYKYSNILLKMYLRSLKNEGKLMFNDVIPYTPSVLSQIVRHSVGDVEKAIEMFQSLGLIEKLDSGAIYITNIQNFIGKSSSEADRKREYRARIDSEKHLEINDSNSGGQTSGQTSDKTPPELEIEIELERELKKDKDDITSVEESSSKWLAMELYQQNFGFPNMVVQEDMKALTKEVTDEVLAHAIRETAKREIRGSGVWAYVEKIVANWKRLNLKTVEAITDYQERWEREQADRIKKPSKGRHARKETVPELFNQEVIETPVSAAEEEEFRKMLADSRKKVSDE
ncbi:phage replisome organizer N-terminal domain-containing protein [Vagococcus salmoninarum]|uniref:DnaD domain-containing protein n=1 Tax=Vagococcus salmoninarum TaxID=2739 RepID=A0A429ZSJ4_9ENTE|nr:phage replisome organizer N-terminal domain-containing protein [Vagococcus salmoninarum]RST96633.1 hypothetical protein CBF35_05215 [Vagococcus salmoninarum]